MLDTGRKIVLLEIPFGACDTIAIILTGYGHGYFPLSRVIVVIVDVFGVVIGNGHFCKLRKG